MQRLQKLQSSPKITVQLQSVQKTSDRRHFTGVSTHTTPTTLQTLGLEKAKYVDYIIHDKLSYFVNKHSSRYVGAAHASWSGKLNSLYQKTKIPIAKIEEYMEPLTKHIESIKHWNVENALNTFTFLSRVGFFNQLDDLTIYKEEVIALRNELMSKISKSLQEVSINETNAIGHVCLLKSVLDQINQDKCISVISEELLKQTCFSLMKVKEPLLSYHYKEVLQTLSEIGNQVNKFIPLFKPLIYKHLDCMANIKISSDNELNFVIFLSGMSKLIMQNFPIQGENKNNLVQLINKTKFTRDSDIAILFLKSITRLLDKNKIPLAAVENKILECIDFVHDRNLNFTHTSEFLVSITKYAESLNKLPESLKIIIDKHFTILAKNKNILYAETLQLLLKALRNLACFNYPISANLKEFSQAIDRNRIDFLNASPKEVQTTITNLAKVLAHAKKQSNDHLILEYSNFLHTLMPKYLATILDTSLNEQINGFTALSILINSGYLANKNMKATFNALLSKLDSEIPLLDHNKQVNFLRVICLNYNLFALKDSKVVEYANKLLEFASSKAEMYNFSIQTKSVILWCLLVFYELNHEKLSKKLLNQFKDAIHSLYQFLDKEKKGNETKQAYDISHLFAANWLGYKVKNPFVENLLENSDVQTQCFRTLQAEFSELHFEEEKSINGLPPCDIVVEDKKIAIEVQGMYHFLDQHRTVINSSTILKNALLRKNDYHVIEIKVVSGKISDFEIKTCFDKIKEILKSQSFHKMKF